jgi:hypothetical protein
MANVLSGHLAYVDIIDVMKLLLGSQQSGRLLLQKEDSRETAEVYLTKGKITHAICGNFLGEPAFRELTLWRTGKFAFEPEATSAQITIDKDTGQLLNETGQYVEAWKRVSGVIPSFSVKVRMTGREPASHVKLKGPDWEVLNYLESGEHSISDIAALLKIKDIDAATLVFALIQAGVVEPGEAAKPVVKESVASDFFENLENELVQLIGPVASIIIDDVVEAFGESRKTFPKDKVPGLVESISNEIYDPQKQVAFQQLMLRQIRSMS